MTAVNVIGMNKYAKFNPIENDIELSDNHYPKITMNQLHTLVRLSNVEYSLHPDKSFSYHLFDSLFNFNQKEAIEFLMTGCSDVFFEAPKEVVLSLVGRYYIGNVVKNYANTQ